MYTSLAYALYVYPGIYISSQTRVTVDGALLVTKKTVHCLDAKEIKE
jgi:hypothetical protein